MDESLSVENRILLCCARRHCDPGTFRALVDGGVDWDALLVAARVHGLLPLLYEPLAEIGGDRIPPDVIARPRGAYYANLLRNRRLLAELAEVVDALHQEGVEAIVLRGGALASTVYTDPAQRPMADLDLLLRREHLHCAGKVLQSLGFRLPDSLPAHMVLFEQRFGSGLHWLRSREDRTTNLDVQHHLVKSEWYRAAFPIEPDALWAFARPLVLDGARVWQLSVEDTLICLCLHPALNHGYAGSLIGYVDIDRVVTAADGDLSWPRLLERAGRFGVKTALYHGLQCTQRLLGMPVPRDVLATLKPSGLRLRLLRRLAPLDPEAVLQRVSRQPSGVKQGLIYAALADPIGARASMIRRLLFPSEEWLAARYGLETQGQARRYRLVHPLRLGRALLRGLHRPLVESSLE